MTVTENFKQILRDRLQPGVRGALNQLRFELAAGRITRSARQQFAALAGKRHLKLHFGAGDDIRLGWINIDLRLRVPPHIDPDKQPDTVFINYDLRRGLPLEAGSVDVIYSSHFFEHLDFTDGLALMKESNRVISAGGRFRISLPDLRKLFIAYLEEDEDYFDHLKLTELYPSVPVDTLTSIDYVNYGAYQHGEHKAIYDVKKTIALLQNAGFSSVKESSFDPSIDPDNDLRRKYSFYIDAIK